MSLKIELVENDFLAFSLTIYLQVHDVNTGGKLRIGERRLPV